MAGIVKDGMSRGKEDRELLTAPELMEGELAAYVGEWAVQRFRTESPGKHELTLLAYGGDTAIWDVGLRVWRAGMLLGEYVYAEAERSSSPLVLLEIGTGTGIGGFAAALSRQVRRVWLTDGEEKLLPLLRLNARLNADCFPHGVASLCPRYLSWTDPPHWLDGLADPALAQRPPTWSPSDAERWRADRADGCRVILGAADCLYEDLEVGGLAAMLHHAAGLVDELIMTLEMRYCSDPATGLRVSVPAYTVFVERCESIGLHLEFLDPSSLPTLLPYDRNQDMRLIRISRS